MRLQGFADLTEEVLALVESQMLAVDTDSEREMLEQVRRRTSENDLRAII